MKTNNQSWSQIQTLAVVLFLCLVGLVFGQQKYKDGRAQVDDNIDKINGTALGATNWLPVRPTDGSNYVNNVTESNFTVRAAALLSAFQSFSNDWGTYYIDWQARTPASLGQKAMAASFPVVIASDQSAIPVTAASLPLPSGAATAANQSTMITQMANWTNGNLILPSITIGQPIPAGTNSIGRVFVDYGSGTFPVSGTFWQATQPVSAASWPLPTGAATAANQQTDALTDTELRASPVDVDASGSSNLTGRVTADAGTDLNTSALALEAGGNLAAAAGSLAVMAAWNDGSGRALVSVQVFKGSANWVTGQTHLTNGPTLIAAARANRRSILIVNNENATCYIGNASVTALTGVYLFGTNGAGINIDTTNAVYGMVSSSSNRVSYVETYD